MSEKLTTDWRLDGEDVVVTIELRMAGHWFIERARQVHEVLSPARRPADRLLERESRENLTRPATSVTDKG